MERAPRSPEAWERSRTPPRPRDAIPSDGTRAGRVTYLQRAAGNHAVSAWLAVMDGPAQLRSGPVVSVQRSFISWIVKMGAKKVSKGTLKNFIATQIKARLKALLDKDMVRRFGKEADDILDALEDPWWATAIGFVPVVGDAFDLARVPKQIKRAFERADRLEAKVSKVLDLQVKKAVDVIPGTLKRSASYASELEHLTYGQLRELAAKDAKAAAMKKLIENEMRLMDKL